MSTWLIAVTGLIYLWVALEQTIKYNDYAMGIVYLGYAFANVGMFVLAMKNTIQEIFYGYENI